MVSIHALHILILSREKKVSLREQIIKKPASFKKKVPSPWDFAAASVAEQHH
jgi:hypothetical protein